MCFTSPADGGVVDPFERDPDHVAAVVDRVHPPAVSRLPAAVQGHAPHPAVQRGHRRLQTTRVKKGGGGSGRFIKGEGGSELT